MLAVICCIIERGYMQTTAANELALL